MEKREYQDIAFKAVQAGLCQKNNFLLAGCCGSGKTEIFTRTALWLDKNNRRTLVILDKKGLAEQTAARIKKYHESPDRVGIVCSGVQKEKQLNHPIVVSSRQTMIQHVEQAGTFNCVVLDEAHNIDQETSQQVQIINKLKEKNPNLRILGTTATPYRMTDYIYGNGKLFDKVDHQIFYKDLLEQGFLVPLRFKCKQSDLLKKLDNVKITSTGELNENDQYEVLKQEKYIKGLYDVYLEHCQNRKTAIFALNIQHAEAIRQYFLEKGKMPFIIHSKMNTKRVKTIKETYEKLDNAIMINVGILTTGSDIPSISAIILARRTMSTALYYQIIGRGARLCPAINKKDCLVIDLCGNLAHGIDPDNPNIHFLQKKGDGNKETISPIKICDNCETAVKLNVKTCPECGFVFEKEEVQEDLRLEAEPEIGKIIDYNPIMTLDITDIKYSYWLAEGKTTPTVKVDFFNGRKRIGSKWLCPEHTGFAKELSNKYWYFMRNKTRDFIIPTNTVQAFLLHSKDLDCQGLKAEVDISGKYPKILKLIKTDGRELKL